MRNRPCDLAGAPGSFPPSFFLVELPSRSLLLVRPFSFLHYFLVGCPLQTCLAFSFKAGAPGPGGLEVGMEGGGAEEV